MILLRQPQAVLESLESNYPDGVRVPTCHPQVAFLDHVFGVVDDETATAVASSDFLPVFGRFEVATVAADEESWTGRYLFGRRTYLELFGPDDLSESDASEASAGLGLSARERGGLDVITERMARWGERVRIGRRTREEGVDQVSWFDYLEAADVAPTFTAWVMEFLEDPSDLQIREAAFEAWMARSRAPASSPDPPGPVLSDLCLVQLTMSAANIAATASMLSAAGFETESTSDLVVAQDAETTIELHTAPGPTELKRVEFTLDSAGMERVETLGRSRITVGPSDRATWDFASP